MLTGCKLGRGQGATLYIPGLSHGQAVHSKRRHRCPTSENSCNFWRFIPFDLLFERKPLIYLLCKLARAGDTSWCLPAVSLGAGFLRKSGSGSDQRVLSLLLAVARCRGVREGTESGHAHSRASKTGSSEVPAFIPRALPTCCLCRAMVPQQPGGSAVTFLLELRRFLEEGCRENLLCRTWAWWGGPGAWRARGLQHARAPSDLAASHAGAGHFPISLCLVHSF